MVWRYLITLKPGAQPVSEPGRFSRFHLVHIEWSSCVPEGATHIAGQWTSGSVSQTPGNPHCSVLYLEIIFFFILENAVEKCKEQVQDQMNLFFLPQRKNLQILYLRFMFKLELKCFKRFLFTIEFWKFLSNIFTFQTDSNLHSITDKVTNGK